MEETDEEGEVASTAKGGKQSFVQDTDEEDSDDGDSNKAQKRTSVAKRTVKASQKKRGRPKEDNGKSKVNSGKNLKVNKNEQKTLKKETPTPKKNEGHEHLGER
jgi:hypothetical protein